MSKKTSIEALTSQMAALNARLTGEQTVTTTVGTKGAPTTEGTTTETTAPAAPSATPDISAAVASALEAAMPTLLAGVKTQTDQALATFRQGRKNVFETPGESGGGAPGISIPKHYTMLDWLVAVGKKGLGIGISTDEIDSIRYEIDKRALSEQSLAAAPNYTGSNSTGGALAPIEFNKTLEEFLYPLVAVRQAGARVYNMNAAEMVIPKPVVATAAGAIFPVQPGAFAEGAAISTSTPQFKQVVLRPQLMSAMVVVSRQLVLDSDPAVEQVLREQMATSLGVFEDGQFLVGGVTGANALYTTGSSNLKGLFGYTTTDGITTAVAGANGATITYDMLVNMVYQLQNQNVQLKNPAWIFHPVVIKQIRQLKDAMGQPIFKSFLEQTQTGSMNLTPNNLYAGAKPTVFGIPVYASQQIPTTQVQGSATNCTTAMLVDMEYVRVGVRGGVEVDASTEAAYNDGSGLSSAFQNNQIVYRILERADIVVTLPQAITTLSGILAV